MAWVQRACLVATLGQIAAETMKRPKFVGGGQVATNNVSQEGCANASDLHHAISTAGDGVPLLQYCWPLAMFYDDVVTFGYNLDGFNNPVFAGYVLRLQDTPVRCEAVLDPVCVEQFGPIVCFYKVYPSDGTATTVDVSESSASKRRLLPYALGGALGGLALVVLAAALVFVARARRRKRPGRGGGMLIRNASASDAAKDGPGASPSESGEGGDRLERSLLGTLPLRQDLAGPGSSLRSEAGCGMVLLTVTDQAASCMASPQLRGPPSPIATMTDNARGVLVTPHTPLKPEVNLALNLASELELLPRVIGKGTFGRVVRGQYGGQPVAVKMLDYGLIVTVDFRRGDDGGGGDGRAASAPPPPQSALQMLTLGSLKSAGAASAAGQQLPEADCKPGGTTPAGAGACDPAAAAQQPTPEVARAAVAVPWATQAEPGPLTERVTEDWTFTFDGRVPRLGSRLEEGTGVPATDSGTAGAGGVVTNTGNGPSTPVGAVMAASSCAIPLPSSADPRQRGLAQEVEVLARCCHPNIVQLLAACLTPPNMCLVMELMETSLDRLLYGSGAGGELLPLPKVLYIGLQIAMGLEYLHPTVFHRDLKPGNVLLSNASSPTPVVKLADFGLSRLQTSVLITKHVGVGTISYMAPETLQPDNCVITHRVDIYALGVILWEMLAGVRPWARMDLVQIAVAVELRRQRPRWDGIAPHRRPAKLQSLVARCWEQDPERRPAAAEVAKELLQLQLTVLNNNKIQKVVPVGLTKERWNGGDGNGLAAGTEGGSHGSEGIDSNGVAVADAPSSWVAGGPAPAGPTAAAALASPAAAVGPPDDILHPVGEQVAALAAAHVSVSTSRLREDGRRRQYTSDRDTGC